MVILFRHNNYSDIDNFIDSNKESFMCTIYITSNIEDLNKLFNPNYHLLVTYGNTYDEYDYISAKIPDRFSSRWFHKHDISNIDEFNHNVNYCYTTNIINSREKTRPIFSIFTTCFKSYDYINTAYESIKNQSLIDWEWVIMDDTPEDEHFVFLKKKLTSDNRVRLYKRDKNSGNIGNVKNEVISLCRGKYILEMDHDDEIFVDCLRDAYNIFKTDKDIGFVYGDTVHLYRNGQNFKYSDFICKGYGGYYSEKIKGKWVYVYNTPNINNITLSHLVCLPNHPRIWNRSVLMELENYSEFLPICDDYEILLRTCCSKYKVAKNNKAQYIQYMNDGGNNFSNIRNSEINRIGPNYISPIFYNKYGVHDKMKELDAYENENYIRNHSPIWKRGEKYQHKKMNQRINLNYDKQYCIINDAINDTRLADLYKNKRNDFLFLSNQMSHEELHHKLESLGFDRMKCYSFTDCSTDELMNYFKMVYANDNCEHKFIHTSKHAEIILGKKRVFIIHNNRNGGVEKYVNDITNLYNKNEYIFIENKEMLYKHNYCSSDLLFIQNLLSCDITIEDIISLYNTFQYKIIIAIHDFIWLCKEQNKYTNDIPSAYLNDNILVSNEVKQLLLLADKLIMNSQFTYDVYSKYFDSSNFTLCYPNDYKIQVGIKNIPKIKNDCINIGIFSPLCKFKGERYVHYLKENFECDTIHFQIVGQNIPYYKEVDFYEYIRKYNINGFLLLNEWGETYGYLLTKIINSGLPLLYNNFGAAKERIDSTQEHYFKVYNIECVNKTMIYSILDSQFNNFVEYINMNHGTVEEMNEDFTIVTKPIYDELFLPIVNREIPKIIFQTSKEILPPYVKELINMYCPNWEYSHFIDKDCIQFFTENPSFEFPNIIQKFHTFTQGQHKADLFRYYYLYLYGGVFLDSDAMFETNIKNIIQDYDSVFAKSFMKNEHLFNGFIATYPRNEIIYNALKHAYNTENLTLQSNYHYLCEELLRIVNTEQKKTTRQNMVIYQEYSDMIDGKSVGRFKNTNKETVFIHYWQEREIPSKLVNSLKPTYLEKQNSNIGIFNSFPFHYEMFGFILNYAKNNHYHVDIFTNQQNNMGWLDFYKNNFDNFNIIDFKIFNGNTNSYDKLFVITDYDHVFKSEWINEKVICINHSNQIKRQGYKHYLNFARFKESIFDYINPCYKLNSFQNKIHNTTVNVIGGGYGLNFSIIKRLHSINKIKLNMFVRNTEQINTEDISILDKNKFDIHFKVSIDTTEMINELNNSSYIFINYNDNHDLNTGNSCSGSLPLALSTLCKPIMTKTSNKYLKIENALEFDIDSGEPINIDDKINFQLLEQERNKYVKQFEKIYKELTVTRNTSFLSNVNNKKIPQICVLYNIPHIETIKYNNWNDGFAEAIRMLMSNENYKIDFINVNDNITINFKEYDLILFKESFNGAIYNKYIKYITSAKIGLFISSSNIIPTDVEIHKYDILFYETYWYYYYANLKRHSLSFHAFGINSNVMKPQQCEKIYDNIFVGAIIDFKNPLKMINKPGNNLCIGNVIDKNIEVQLKNNNVIVEDYVDYLSLSNKYNQSKKCFLPCSLHGGGERAVLEARSCNIEVEIDENNDKLKELLNSPIYNQDYYYSQILLGLGKIFNKPFEKKTLNLLYHIDRGNGNFGDEISKFIIGNLINNEKYNLVTNMPCNDSKYINIIGIGSYIQCAPNNCTIFGSGIRTNPPIEPQKHNYSNLNVKAVRGPLSKEFLSKKNIHVPDIYGDPALLLPLFYKPMFLSNLQNKIGIIPHISNYNLYSNQNIPDKFKLICPYDKWETVINEIYSCKYIISSALHGLICSDAYNKPNIWLNEFKLNEGEFKFKDYFLSQNRDFINISKIEEFDETKLYTKGNIIDLEKLKNAFIYI